LKIVYSRVPDARRAGMRRHRGQPEAKGRQAQDIAEIFEHSPPPIFCSLPQ
jgi:hypothetical protein